MAGLPYRSRLGRAVGAEGRIKDIRFTSRSMPSMAERKKPTRLETARIRTRLQRCRFSSPSAVNRHRAPLRRARGARITLLTWGGTTAIARGTDCRSPPRRARTCPRPSRPSYAGPPFAAARSSRATGERSIQGRRRARRRRCVFRLRGTGCRWSRPRHETGRQPAASSMRPTAPRTRYVTAPNAGAANASFIRGLPARGEGLAGSHPR